MNFFLTEAQPLSAGEQVNSIVSAADGATEGVLSIGTKIFNWALSNPIYVLLLIVMIIFIVVGIIKKFTR